MSKLLTPIEGIGQREFWLRLGWASLQLLIVYFFMSHDDPFFYQGF